MQGILNSILLFIICKISNKRAVVVVNANGEHRVCTLKYTDSGKAYIVSKDSVIGFLDNPNQKEGEFRKGISSDNLVRWFTVS